QSTKQSQLSLRFLLRWSIFRWKNGWLIGQGQAAIPSPEERAMRPRSPPCKLNRSMRKHLQGRAPLALSPNRVLAGLYSGYLPIAGECHRLEPPARSARKFPAKVDPANFFRAPVPVRDRAPQTQPPLPCPQWRQHFLSRRVADFRARRRNELVQSEFRCAKTKSRRPWDRKICAPQNWRHRLTKRHPDRSEAKSRDSVVLSQSLRHGISRLRSG